MAASIGAVVLAGGSFASPGGSAMPAVPAGLGDAPQVDPAVLAAEGAAAAQARSTGKPVPVGALTDESAETIANPDGTFTTTQHAVPVRVRRGAGFVPVDTTLAERADGMVAPGAVDTDVVFSGGGKTPLATLTKGGASYSISWPGALPAPVLSGDSATYSEVLPGVDLVMTARVDGYGEVLVVKTPAAAANPALATLHFGVHVTGATLTKAADGTEVAVDAAGKVRFSADTPIMWDSADTGTLATTPHAAPATPVAGAHKPGTAGAPAAGAASPAGPVKVPAPAGADPSDVRHPGAAAHVAAVGMTVKGADLAITPDHALLTGPDRVFPLYVDPSETGTPSVQAWADINSAGGKWTSGTDAPIGLDNWSGCSSYCGSVARAYFEMNDSFFQGATIPTGGATFWIWFSWAADSAAKPTQVWLDPDYPSNLDWANKPTASSPSTYVNTLTSCYGHQTSGCPAGLVPIDVTSAAKIAAGGGRRDLEVDAADETDAYQWKRVDPTKTYWQVTFYRAPYLNAYATTPKVTGPGGTFVNSSTVTMQASGGDTDNELIASHYEIWNWVNGAATTSVVTGLSTSTYTATGGPAVKYTLPADGTYAWRATAESQQGAMWSGWGPWQVFTVDGTVPPVPTVESPQFPAGDLGGSYTDTGKFTLSTQGQDNVAGFIFSLDGDLGSLVWSASGQPATYGGGAVTRGSQYWAPVSNGTAVLSFSPATVGVHRLFVKAVDQAGLTSPEATYMFNAGLTTPSYAYGDQLADGCPVNACNGNTVAVPAAAAAFSTGGQIYVQSDCCNLHFADGKQVMMANNGTSKVAVNDSAVYSFNLPSAGMWDIGASLTGASDYGQYSLTLDKGTATQAVLTPMYDAYTPLVTLSYHDFGIATGSTGSPLQLAAGLHTVTMTVTGKNSSSLGYQTGIDMLRFAPQSATCSITDLSACQNNVAISSDTNHLAADADGWGNSFSATQLGAAGWTAGASFTVDGAPMTLPNYGGGKADNVLASGQTVTVPSTYPNNGNALEFLAFGTEGQVTGAAGTITYGKACNSTPTQTFTIDSVPSWVDTASAAKRLAGFTSLNNDSGTSSTVPQVYVISVPLDCPGYPVASVTLPVVSDKALQKVTAMHILAMGIRASSYTDTGDTANWTGTFAAAVDSHLGTLGAQTVRMPVHISVSGSQIRLRLSNQLGTVPVSFDHVTVAAQGSGAVPAATPVDVHFGGGAAVKIPAGGEVVSDPLAFTTTGQETLLVSVHLSAADSDVVGHGSAQFPGWTAAAGTDQAADTTGTPFTTGIPNVDWLTAVDVTSANSTLGSLVLFGDQTVNSDTASSDGQHRLADVLTAKLAAANGGSVPYGVLSDGTNSWNQADNLLPALSASASNTNPPSATDPAGVRILEGSNVRTVLISTGMSDILAGSDATTIENKLSALSQQVRHFYTDDAMDASVTLNNNAALVTVYLATIPPNATALTAGQEAVREAVNSWILTTNSGSYANGNADGAIDFAAAVSSTGTDAGTTIAAADLYNGAPNDTYYSLLAQQYLTNTATPPAPTNTVGVQPMVVR